MPHCALFVLYAAIVCGCFYFVSYLACAVCVVSVYCIL
jgi:hypothetical protein